MTPPAASSPPPPADDAAPGRPAPRASGASWVGGIALALLLYVFSIGPILGLADKGYAPLSDTTLQIIYAPIAWCCDADSSGTVKKCVWWYLELCG